MEEFRRRQLKVTTHRPLLCGRYAPALTWRSRKPRSFRPVGTRLLPMEPTAARPAARPRQASLCCADAHHLSHAAGAITAQHTNSTISTTRLDRSSSQRTLHSASTRQPGSCSSLRRLHPDGLLECADAQGHDLRISCRPRHVLSALPRLHMRGHTPAPSSRFQRLLLLLALPPRLLLMLPHCCF
jgi:hypothetical protein